MSHRYLVPSLIAAFSVMSCRGEVPPLRGAVLAYEPTVVELSGTLTLEQHYGPPNFGENPQTDEKLQVPVLALAAPISVPADTTSELNRTPVSDVRRVQLSYFDDSISINRFINTRVVVTGTLSHAISGQDFTDIVLHVQSLHGAR